MGSLWELFVAFSLLYFMAINIYYTVLLGLSFFAGRDRVREITVTNFDVFSASNLTPPVSILIPAHNEEAVIVNSVYAALSLDYNEFEIIVVNDRSTDRTLRRLIETFELVGEYHPFRAIIPTMPIRRVYRSKKFANLIVIDKEQGGKADALNVGLNISRYPYICNTDADTIFEKNALSRIMRPIMLDPKRVVAVGGQVRVGNGFIVKDGNIVERHLPMELLPVIQLVEYLRTFIGNRVGWSKINGMLLISGAFGCWKRQTLVSVGGFSTEVTGEDLEVTLRIHRVLRLRGEEYRILSLPDPVCWTEVPADLATFKKQRNRWHRVLLESFVVHRNMLLNPFFGVPGMLGMPTYFFFEILGPFVEFFSYFVVLIGLAMGFIDGDLLIGFLLMSIAYTTILNLVAIIIEDINYHTYNMQEVIKLVLVGIFENIGYRQYTMFIRIVATIDWLGKVKAWGSMPRQGLFLHGTAADPSLRRMDMDGPYPKSSMDGMLPEGVTPETAPYTEDETSLPGKPSCAIPESAGSGPLQAGQPLTGKKPGLPVSEKNKWKIPAELGDHSPWQVFAGRIAATILVFSLPYFIFVFFTHFIFSPTLRIEAIMTPEKVAFRKMPIKMGMRVKNTGRSVSGAGYLVAILDGEKQFDGPVQYIPPGEFVDLGVALSAEPGNHTVTLILYDAWKQNLRVDSRQGIGLKVTGGK